MLNSTHPFFVHLPIASLTALVFCDLAGLFSTQPIWDRLRNLLLAVGLPCLWLITIFIHPEVQNFPSTTAQATYNFHQDMALYVSLGGLVYLFYIGALKRGMQDTGRLTTRAKLGRFILSLAIVAGTVWLAYEGSRLVFEFGIKGNLP